MDTSRCGLLDGSTVLVTGVLTEDSIASAVARVAHEQGARLVLTSFGRAMRLTERAARRLELDVPVVELDVTDDDHLASLAGRLRDVGVDRLDGVLHSIAYAPPGAIGESFLDAPWEDVAVALRVSTYSFAALARATRPLLGDGASIVGLDFDASVAWTSYAWMGVAKAGLEACARYVARELGPSRIRVNLVAAGPISSAAARGVPAFDVIAQEWKQWAPIGWDLHDAEPVARACVALLSGWLPATTGAIVFADGGFHAVGL